MKNLLFAAPMLLLLSACNPATPSTEGTPAAGAPATATQPATPPNGQPATPPANARQAAPAGFADLLQGKWQSTDDPKAVVEFVGNQRKEAGISETFTLGDRCTNAGDAENGAPAEKDHYITVAESDMCWYIVDLTADHLSLSYVGRGNTLEYKRM